MTAGSVIEALKRPRVHVRTGNELAVLLRLVSAVGGTAAGLAIFGATRSWELAILADLAIMTLVAVPLRTVPTVSRGQAALVALVLPASAVAFYSVLEWLGLVPAVALLAAFAASYIAQVLTASVVEGARDSQRSPLGRLLETRVRAGLRSASAISAATVGVIVAVFALWATAAWALAVVAGSAVGLAITSPIPHIDRTGPLAVRVAARILAALAAVLLVLVGALLVLAMQPYTPMLAGVAVVVLAVALARLSWRPFGIGLAVVIALAAVGVTGSQLMASTPPFVDASGTAVPGSVASIDRISLGGVNQTIVVRGRSERNPVLLFLSGGPGPTQLAWHRQYLGSLEDHFTVVYWEQRGSGRSGGLALADWDRMTPEQYTAEGLELTAYLRERFGQERIYIAGQSWGTMVGVWMVQQQPEWFAAYVGIGQMTNPVEDDRLIYQYVLDRARREGDAEFVRSMEAQGRPPYDGFLATTKYGALFARAKDYEQALVAASHPDPIAPLVGMTETSEYGLADTVAAYLDGAVTFARVYDQLDRVDFDSQVSRLDVPVYLAEGRWDTNAMPVLAERWLNKLEAPSKALVWFEHSGHNPEHEEPEAFIDFIVNKVLAETR